MSLSKQLFCIILMSLIVFSEPVAFSDPGDEVFVLETAEEIFSEEMTIPGNFYRIIPEFTLDEPGIEILMESDNGVELFIMTEGQYFQSSLNNFGITFSSYYWGESYGVGVKKIDEVLLLDPVTWHVVLINRKNISVDVDLSINKGVVSMKKETALSLSLQPSDLELGEQLVINGTFSPRMSDKLIEITIENPEGKSETRKIYTDPNGDYTLEYAPDASGLWTVSAKFPGDDSYKNTDSEPKQFGVNMTYPEIVLDFDPPRPILHRNLSIICSFSPRTQGTINLTYTRPDNTLLQKNIKVINGKISDLLHPNQTGKWTLTMQKPSENLIYPIQESFSFQVNRIERELDLQVPETSIIFGQSFIFNGSVNPPSAYEIELSDASNWRAPPIENILCNENGTFYYKWSPDTPGEYYIRLHLDATEEYSVVNSNAMTLKVLKIPVELDVELSSDHIMPGEELEISGSITPNEGYVAMPLLSLVFYNPEGNDIPKVCRVEDDGTFSLEYSSFYELNGEWKVNITWPGDETHSSIEPKELAFSYGEVASEQETIEETEQKPEESKGIPGFSPIAVIISLLLLTILNKMCLPKS